ncbi:hypothetical protein [Pedobacter steynii]|uniref:Uncharacterized protein n=1 Tax=Pedobacter steynii TaxID=430522 RepID=A0A1D7QJ66_9SPHI|nr:hypothetical protein [Pedobacter steynii]AOM78716.1 hypothetical protein BFS30_16960 [Pedobacter steynii]
MNRNSGIQRKAAFLLIVFLLNTVVGFACSVGMEMGAVEHHHHSSKAEKAADDCCTDKVQKIERTDKLSPPVVEFSSYQPFYTLIFPNYFLVEASVSALEISRPKHPDRDYHLPISDIRIALQSFQI